MPVVAAGDADKNYEFGAIDLTYLAKMKTYTAYCSF